MITAKKPERVAWLVILGAFLAFLTLCAAVPVSARSYLLFSTSLKPANFEVNAGTPRVQEKNGTAPIAVTGSIRLSEGSTIETDENSRGILTLFDESKVIIFPNTRIVLQYMQVSTFDWGQVPITFRIEQTRGRTRVAPAPIYDPSGGPAHSRSFQIDTLHSTSMLTEGSYAIEVYPDSTQIIVTNGSADVSGQGRTVTVGRGQRTVVTRGNSPLLPLPAALDLITNGDFLDPVVRGWNSIVEQPAAGASIGRVEVTPLDDLQTLHILRSNAGQVSAITGVIQQVNREVSDFRTLKLMVDIRIQSQSLAGGGVLSSEYPLILRLRYRDQYGSEGEWVRGFYIQNAFNNPTNNGEQISQDVWFPFESGNLFELADPRPFYITTVQIYASGWDYESYFTNVRLIAE